MAATALSKRLLARIEVGPRFGLVDIGAYGGLEPEWHRLRDDIRVISFEPDERDACASNVPEDWVRLQKIVAHQSADLQFYVAREAGKSSTLRPNFDALNVFPEVQRFATVQEARIPGAQVTTLDAALRESGAADPDFLKIDVQGAELAVLSGAQACLTESLVAMKVEVGFFPIYSGQCLFPDVDEYVRSYGFQIMDLRRVYWKHKSYADFVGRGQLVFGDALYLRSPDSLAQLLQPRGRDERRAKVMKCLVACLVYGMHPYATHLVERLSEVRLLDSEFCRGLAREIRSDGARWSRSLPPIYRSLRAAAGHAKRLVFGPRSLWAEGDQHLGNM